MAALVEPGTLGAGAGKVSPIMRDTGQADAVEAEVEAPGPARGKWVLILETQVLDSFDSREEAVRAGYTRLRDVPFVVRRVPSETD